jgi:UDP-N-acetylglucosamine--N-acetylmuramyl-(pentapeptide) pyrophosphoryl-undecaprenol N-acetylglucosamine transferase
LPAALALLPEDQRPEVRHQAGERTLEIARAAYAACRRRGRGHALHRRHGRGLRLGRSGGLPLRRADRLGTRRRRLPAIFVPFPFAVDDHQVGNARWLSDAGAARLIIQRDLTREGLARELEELLADPAKRLAMAEAARAKARGGAIAADGGGAMIADACLARSLALSEARG